MRAAALICLAAAVAIVLPSVIARARTNHRARKARIALAGASTWLDTLVEEALVEGVQDDPIYQRLCFERWESELSGGAS